MSSPDPNHVGRRIFLLRSIRKQSQKDFAMMIGISTSYLSELENGRKTPGSDVVRVICELHQLDEEWLLEGDDRISLARAFWRYVGEMQGYSLETNKMGFVDSYNHNLLTDIVPLPIRETRKTLTTQLLDECLEFMPDHSLGGFPGHKKRFFSSSQKAVTKSVCHDVPVLPKDWFDVCVQLAAAGITPKEVLEIVKRAKMEKGSDND